MLDREKNLSVEENTKTENLSPEEAEVVGETATEDTTDGATKVEEVKNIGTETYEEDTENKQDEQILVTQISTEEKDMKRRLMIEGLIVEPPDIYLENGIHIGLKFKTSDMRPYIYRIKSARTPKGWIKISVFDVAKIDKRIQEAAKFLSAYDPKDVVIVSNGLYGRRPASMFAKYCGFKFINGRFDSGTFTNINSKKYMEPKVVFITDPVEDKQAIKEAVVEHIPVIAFANSNIRLKNIDFVIPGNNAGKYSLAMLYWLLTMKISKIKGFEFNVPVPRSTAVNADGKELPHEFVSNEEAANYLLEMKQINKALLRKRRNKKGSIKIKKNIIIR